MQGTKRVAIALVALKCEVGRGHRESVAHNVILRQHSIQCVNSSKELVAENSSLTRRWCSGYDR